MTHRFGLTLFLLLAGCERVADAPGPADETARPAANAAAPVAGPQTPAAGAGTWDLQSSGEGAALALSEVAGGTAIRLFCPAGQSRLLVNVPGLRPIGSEERLSFGSRGDVVALVADPAGDRQRGGVSGLGAVPANLAALLGGRVSASYGAQSSGPHPAIPAELARAFVGACREGTAATPAPKAPVAPPVPAQGNAAGAGPCFMQGSERIRVASLRAIGTEPFWGARVEGRCVTYSHPENQTGTRIWTRYAPGPGGAGTWSGALGGRNFQLSIRPAPGCSDGMSDRVHPMAAELLVGGERRRGCAAPA